MKSHYSFSVVNLFFIRIATICTPGLTECNIAMSVTYEKLFVFVFCNFISLFVLNHCTVDGVYDSRDFSVVVTRWTHFNRSARTKSASTDGDQSTTNRLLSSYFFHCLALLILSRHYNVPATIYRTHELPSTVLINTPSSRDVINTKTNQTIFGKRRRHTLIFTRFPTWYHSRGINTCPSTW